ncbi:MAG: DUF4112 domain-containing protein [Cyanophyceae cyanobacterium]
MTSQREPIKRQQQLEQLRSLSYFLDSAIPIPGTDYRVGLDPLLGLFPGVGDYLGTAFSTYIVLQAARLGASKATLSRMALNIMLDTVIGNVPLLGDLFDATWKANRKNIALLETHLRSPLTRSRVDWWFFVLLLGSLLLFVAAAVALNLWLFGQLLQSFRR